MKRNGFRHRYIWHPITVGAVLVVLIGEPVVGQVREHHDEGVMIEYRAVKDDHGHDRLPPLKIASPRVVQGTAAAE
jgi:hypothetical protein